MDPKGNIYRGPEDMIPAEDKARLDGYLLAKAEKGEALRLLEEAKAEFDAKVAEIEAKSGA